MKRKLVQILASTIDARLNCLKIGNDWAAKHKAMLEELARNYLPHGSGFDCGTKIDLDASTGEKIVLTTSFHHMSEHGYYDGWTEHTITIRASLVFGYDLKIGGRDRNEIKDYIADAFRDALSAELEPDESGAYKLAA